MTQIMKTKIVDSCPVKRRPPGIFKISEPFAGFFVKEKILRFSLICQLFKAAKVKFETGTLRGGLFFDLIIDTAILSLSKSDFLTLSI